MRNFLLGLPISLFLVQFGYGACLDTTIVLQAGAPGFNSVTGVYDPTTAGAVNTIISGCPDTSITVRINLATALFTSLKDTIKLAQPLRITNRANKTTVLTTIRKPTNPPAGVVDTIITFVPNNDASPALLVVDATNRGQISNFGFARKSIANALHSVTISGKGSKIQGCHFWMADNSSDLGALLEIEADSVLVERSLFRAPPDGVGRSFGIRSAVTAQKLEIRSNVFFSTGLQLTTGSFHIYANTFTGSRNLQNCIVIGSSVTAPETNVSIQHNLFVPKVDTIPPIVFGALTVGVVENVLKNAYSSSSTVPVLAIDGTGKALNLNGATGLNANTLLPRGFSNYGPTAPDAKDYPLTQLRTDATLAANHVDFGKMFRVFTTSSWTTIQDVKDGLPAPKLYFDNFTPFTAGTTWLLGTKVGAFVSADAVESPTPLKSGVQGGSLTFIKDSTNATRIRMTATDYDPNYYKATIYPEVMYFFFSDTLSKLTGSNDTTALKTATGNSVATPTYISKPFLGDDSLLSVPKVVRNGKSIFVKMLHFRKTWQAPVLSNAAIATVTGVPSFPANDLVLTLNPGASDYANGQVSLSVSHGAEAIDSIRVVVAREDGSVETSKSLKPAGLSTTFTFSIASKGTFYFYAVPIASLGLATKAGQPTPNSAPVPIRSLTGDTVYVKYVLNGSCPGALGTSALPYCVLDSAMHDVFINKGGTIVVRNETPNAVAMEDLVIAPYKDSASDTSAVTITNVVVPGAQPALTKFEPNRPIIRGKTKEALTITRKNVTLRGFVIEMPAGSTGRAAVSVKAGGVLLDANIFRTQLKTLGVEGPAVNIEVGKADMRMTNNVVWGFTKAIQVKNSGSAGIRIVNNTFLDDALVPNTGTTVGLSVVGDSLNAIVANNFFSGITTPLDASVAGKNLKLDHNVFTTSRPQLQGLIDEGALDSNDAVASMDLTSANYAQDLTAKLADAFSCSSIHPCPSLQAASSTTDYKVNLNTDITGKPRPVKKDVGAFEVDPVPGTPPLGRLLVKASRVLNVFSQVKFEISSKNYDPAESDSIFVWWTTSASKVFDPNLPNNQQQHYAMSKLEPGSFSGTADGLSEKTAYNFYAAYVRSGTPTQMGYVYSDTLTTSINVEPGDCSFALSKTVCPSSSGYFTTVDGPWVGKFLTRITFSQPTQAGDAVKNPVFTSLLDTKKFKLSLDSPLPMITFVMNVAGMDGAGSKQEFTANIEMDVNPPLDGKELFLLPQDTTQLPIHVSNWKLVPPLTADGKTILVIKGNQGGTLNYAFGTLAVGVEPGKIEAVNPLVSPVFDYVTAGDSINLIPFNIKGSGFKTANPLVLVSVVPAGGVSSNVLAGRHPISTLALSSDLGDLDSADQKARFYDYYLKAAGADARPIPPANRTNPLEIDTVTAEALNSALVYKTPKLVIAKDGSMAPLEISIPMHHNYKDGESGRKASRSIEVVFTVFDGSRVVQTSGYIRSHFANENLQNDDLHEFTLQNAWNLYGYPWDEAESGTQTRIVGGKSGDKWDPDHMRLLKYLGTGTGVSSFTKFDGTNAGSVKFDSGQAIWSGRDRPYTPQSLTGYSLDYETFKLALPAGQYTDFSLPFNFPIRVKDILEASGLTVMPTMFRFKAGRPGSWEALDANSILKPWEGLTIKPITSSTLSFPVLDTVRSTLTAGTPKQAVTSESQWLARVQVFNGTAAMNLAIGKSTGEATLFEPPSVPGQDFRVSLKQLKPDGTMEGLSKFVQTEDGTWQGQWSLRTSAENGSKQVFLRVTDNSKGIPLYLVETLHQTVVALSGDSVAISGADLRANDYHLVAGDGDFLKDVLAGLLPAYALSLANYPNPFSGSTLIRYGMPTSFGKVDYSLKVRDFRGRTVFEKNISAVSSLSFVWDGRDKGHSVLPAGVYTLSLEARALGRSPYRATRRLLKL